MQAIPTTYRNSSSGRPGVPGAEDRAFFCLPFIDTVAEFQANVNGLLESTPRIQIRRLRCVPALDSWRRGRSLEPGAPGSGLAATGHGLLPRTAPRGGVLRTRPYDHRHDPPRLRAPYMEAPGLRPSARLAGCTLLVRHAAGVCGLRIFRQLFHRGSCRIRTMRPSSDAMEDMDGMTR